MTRLSARCRRGGAKPAAKRDPTGAELSLRPRELDERIDDLAVGGVLSADVPVLRTEY